MGCTESGRRGRAAKTDLGVIGSMDCEVSLLLRSLDGLREEKAGLATFYTGRLNGARTVVAKAGEGKVNAASCAAAMAVRYSPRVIVNTGCAGALDRSLRVNDTVVATEAVEYDLDYGLLGHPGGTVFFPDGTSLIAMPADREVADMLCEAGRILGIDCVRGTVATGDRFVSDPAVKAAISERHGAAVCEMEGAAVLHACRLFGIRCGIVRSVSDLADGDAGVSFAEVAATASGTSAKLVAAFAGLIRDRRL